MIAIRRGLKYSFAFSAIMILASTSAIAQGPAGEEGDYVSQVAIDVRLANERFYEAWTNRDLWAMSRVWVKEDYVSAIHPAHFTLFQNWDNVRKSWKQTFDHNRDIKIRMLAGALHVAGDVAWVIDSTRFEAFQTQTGQPILMNNILTTKIFENHGDKWLLVHYHAHLPKFTTQANLHEQPPEGGTGVRLPDAAEEANEAFYHAWSNLDLEAMDAVWAKAHYVSALHPDFPVPFLGWSNVRTSWQRIFDHNRDIKLRTRTDSKHLAGDVAWVVASTDLDATQTETGQHIHVDNILTTKIFEKKGDTWQLVHFHAHRGPSLDHVH